jgi:hypothetical protein
MFVSKFPSKTKKIKKKRNFYTKFPAKTKNSKYKNKILYKITIKN